MRWKRLIWPTALAALASAAGCGDDEPSDGTTSGTGGNPTGAAIADLVVDANRDGVASFDDPGDQDNEDLPWSAEFGASFLTNIDDDDGDGVRDADDEIVNGPADELDLARIKIAPYPDVPDDATAALHLDELSAANTRLFKKLPDGTWTLVAGTFGTCIYSTDPPCTTGSMTVLLAHELREGVEFGIEAIDFARKAPEAGGWSSVVQLTYIVSNAAGEVLGEDAAKIKAAPWMLFGNLSPMSRVYTFGPIGDFVAGLKPAVEGAGVEYTTHSPYPDRWTQDWFQTGWAAIPVAAEGGGVTAHGMRYANARSHSQAANGANPYDYLRNAYLGSDRGIFVTYEKYGQSSTFDSHGNHDLIPPHTSPDGTAYPLGRILFGEGQPGPIQATREFYNAQRAQGPYLTVNTNFLAVGHVDEIFSYVPAATDLGWKLLVGNPTLSRSMLQAAEAAGNGATIMHGGKFWQPGVPADISISEALADVDLMAASQESQGSIDTALDIMIGAVGLDPATEVIDIPFLIEELGGGFKVAYQPGTANMLVFGDNAVIADPWGPVIDGVDIFKQDLLDRLGTAVNQLGSDGQGMTLAFADDWTGYHINLGEVHCGTNAEASAPFDPNFWWEIGR